MTRYTVKDAGLICDMVENNPSEAVFQQLVAMWNEGDKNMEDLASKIRKIPIPYIPLIGKWIMLEGASSIPKIAKTFDSALAELDEDFHRSLIRISGDHPDPNKAVRALLVAVSRGDVSLSPVVVREYVKKVMSLRGIDFELYHALATVVCSLHIVEAVEVLQEIPIELRSKMLTLTTYVEALFERRLVDEAGRWLEIDDV